MTLALTEALLQTELRQYIGDKSDTFADRRLHRACIQGLNRLSRRRSWSFHRDMYSVNAVPDYIDNASTAAVAISATAVTIAGGAAPSNAVGAFIEFNGQRRAYEITVRTSGTDITLRNAYGNTDATNLTVATWRIIYPAIDLPANFKTLRRVIDNDQVADLEIVESDEIEAAHSSRSSVGTPDYCSVRPKRNDPNIMQLWLYPAPDLQNSYNILYNRVAGWYDSATVATAAFALEPTTTSYYVDWPLALKDLLLASCKLSLITEGVKGLDYNAAYSDYRELLRDAESDDERQPEVLYLGRSIPPQREEFRIGT